MHIYFHDDFDGTSCAALLLNFFQTVGQPVTSLNPIDYCVDLKSRWPTYPFAQPFTIVDFRYHPLADWWFDHHLTTFWKPEWETGYRYDRQHFFDPRSPSCYGLILDFLEREHNFKPAVHLQKWRPEADKIDSANFKGPAEILFPCSEAGKVALLLSDNKVIDVKEQEVYQRQIIYHLAEGRLKDLWEDGLQPYLFKIKTEINHSLDWARKKTEIRGQTAFFNGVEAGRMIIYPHFVMRYLFPRVLYTLFLSPKNDECHVGMAWNKWQKTAAVSKIAIGELAQKYGGGGHQEVGGFEKATPEEALKDCREIVEYLNEHG